MVNINTLSTVTMMVGLPGSGKTTFAASIVKQVIRKNKRSKVPIRVFSNVPIKGAFSYSWASDFGNFDMSNSIIILDEAGLDVDNRSWEKNFNRDKVEFLKLLRHYHSKMVVFSQTWNDCDIKIRSMTGLLYIVKKSIIPFCTVAVPVVRRIDVDEDTHDFKELYYKDFPLLRIFSTRRIIRPFYYKMFDSWDCPEKPAKEWDVY